MGRKAKDANLEGKLAEAKALVRRKGALFFSEIEEALGRVSAAEKKELIRKLRQDKSVSVVEGDMVEWAEQKPLAENGIYKTFQELKQLSTGSSHIKAGSALATGLTAAGFPEHATELLRHVLLEQKNIDVAVHLAPASALDVKQYVKAQLEEAEAGINSLAEAGIRRGGEFEELLSRQRKLQNRLSMMEKGCSFFSLSLFFVAKGGSEEELGEAVGRAVALMRKSGAIVKPAVNYQQQAFKSAVPLGFSFLKRREVVASCDLLASQFPFAKPQ